MKRILKKEVIIAFIVGVLMTGGIVYATTYANQVTYTRAGTNIVTVADALNDLYDKRELGINANNVYFAESNGTNATSITTTLNLNKGKYIIFISYGLSWVNTSTTNSESDDSNSIEISSQSNNCDITALKGYSRVKTGTSNVNGYRKQNHYTRLYYVNIKEDSDIVTHSYTGANQSENPVVIHMYAVKL